MKVVVGVVIGCGLVLSDYSKIPLFLLQHWEKLAPEGHYRHKPSPKWGHAATSFMQSQLGNLILAVEGVGSKTSWIFDIRTRMWEKVSVANS